MNTTRTLSILTIPILALIFNLSGPSTGFAEQGCVRFDGIDHCPIASSQLHLEVDGSALNVLGIDQEGEVGVLSLPPTNTFQWYVRIDIEPREKEPHEYLSAIATFEGELSSSFAITSVDGESSLKVKLPGPIAIGSPSLEGFLGDTLQMQRPLVNLPGTPDHWGDWWIHGPIKDFDYFFENHGFGWGPVVTIGFRINPAPPEDERDEFPPHAAGDAFPQLIQWSFSLPEPTDITLADGSLETVDEIRISAIIEAPDLGGTTGLTTEMSRPFSITQESNTLP